MARVRARVMSPRWAIRTSAITCADASIRTRSVASCSLDTSLATLTQAELHNLTGYKSNARQRAWLTAEGVPFRIDKHRRIIVASEHVTKWVQGVELRPSSGPRMDMVA